MLAHRHTLAGSILVALVAAAAPALATSPGAGSVESCATPATRTQPIDTALEAGLTRTVVREQNTLTRTELGDLIADDTTWVDECANVFVVEDAIPASRQDTPASAAAGTTPDDVFDLSSRPSSTRTIYLDFNGDTRSGTRWKSGEQIVSPAYSIDTDPSTFTDVERTQIHLAWRSVAEDFAPFDVNVTTRVPAADDLTRTTVLDPTYGTTVVVTPTNSVGTGCGCGGQAYIGVFGNAGANDFHPAWVFTHGSGTNGYNLGQVIAHEAGHTLGLAHDSTPTASYYSGAKSWAPIMGSSYGKRVSHWSNGEYLDATNTEDDTAILARVAPLMSDDHTATRAGATPLTVNTPAPGLLTTRGDTDAFTFTGAGLTTLSVTGPVGVSNVDVRLSIFDALGNQVAALDPVADIAGDDTLNATWTATLPAPASTYTAIVDGTGHGDPAQAGQYSDYGSIGTYTVTLTNQPPPPTTPTPAPDPTQTPDPTPVPPTTGVPDTTPDPTSTPTPGTPTPGTGPATSSTPVAFTTTRLPKARVGKKYRTEIRFTGAVSEARVDWRLPRGLTWRERADRILITGKVRKAGTSRFTAFLSGPEGTVRHQFRLKAR